jgi:Ca2+-binding RTX toxin-like protein
MSTINYNGGSQTVIGSNSGDTITASLSVSGNDRVFARGGSDTVFSGFGNDTIFGGDGNDTLHGEGDNDTLFGGLGNDTLLGGAGDDTLAVEVGFDDFGTDRLSGGDGFDTIVFRTANIIEVNGSPAVTSIANAGEGLILNMKNVFAPGLVGSFQQGAGGSETVFDFLTDLHGSIRDTNGTTAVFDDIERIVMTDFDDAIFDSSASHVIEGGKGDDYISGGGGADNIIGNDGNDTAMYGDSASGVSISLLDFGNGGSGSGGDAEGDKLFDIENVFASSHNDFVLGNEKNNTLNGENGNDTLLGGKGSDTIDGGADDDTLRGGLGNDTVKGGEGIDTALFSDWNGTAGGLLTTISTNISLADGETASTAQLLSSTISGFPVRVVTTTLETDTLSGIENVVGTDFADTITGNSAGNTLEGRNGNDTLDGGKGSDTLIGGEGIDTARFLVKGSIFEFDHVDASLADGEATMFRTLRSGLGFVTTTETDALLSIENLTGTAGSDHLTGDANANILDGGAGLDTLAGLGGADKLIGGEGLDTADYSFSTEAVTVNLATGAAAGGDAAGDTFSSIENLTGSNAADQLTGNSAVNIINGLGNNDIIEGGASGDTLDGGTGNNTLSFEGSAGVIFSLDATLAATGDAEGDVVFNFQNISGSLTGDDTLRGDNSDNLIKGNGGADHLSGGLGADTLDGGAQFDFADYRNDGAVTIDLQNNIFNGAAAGDTFISIEGVIGGNGDNVLKGNDADNTFITFTGTNTLQGRGGFDTLTGGSGIDTITGGAGDDTMDGGTDGDDLQGNADDDTLLGNGGADRLNGGTGNDDLTGGQGRDTFVFTGNNGGQDTIRDWQDGIDTIEFNSGLVGNFADLTIAGNGTDHVTVIYGGNAIDIFSTAAITLSAQDFSIL